MLTLLEAQQLVGAWLGAPQETFSREEMWDIVDAHIMLHYPVPQSLGEMLAEECQPSMAPGWILKLEPYLGRIRVLTIKKKAAAQWAARPPGEHD